MKNITIMACLLAGIAVLGLLRNVGAETGANPQPEERDDPVAIRIIESSVCAENGIRLGVEIRNHLDGAYRFSICPDRLLCCVKDMFVVINYADTAIGLPDDCATDNPEPGEVYLVKGAVYSFPLTIPLDRLPEACQTPGRSLEIKLGFLTVDGKSIYSDKATVNLKSGT